MVSLTTCLQGCAPRVATPVTPGRPNLADGIAKTAALLGFEASVGRGLMPWQPDRNGRGTELDPSGGFVFLHGRLVVGGEEGLAGGLVEVVGGWRLGPPG